MENWFKKNKNYVIIALVVLLLFKTVQSCNRGTSITIQEKKMSHQCDSLLNDKSFIIKGKNYTIDSLNNELLDRTLLIKDLSSDLKVAGVKASEAQKRAAAIQRTAEKIKANTTIEINGLERDTTKIK